ncbi:hypothetical protein HELRODRAFT_182517 [Helobdella robusta]|uniref:Gamma-tubulin complex component n=1 Tax=Helobdella robusta TaxID=6412 RepID=T1FIB1_HELRO|nr:hypothetical protein HELRODRAFT_182517 [Helobdella robusta]ESN90925.1 hypothetical protein HELRODRAFT_182517 [Helobdella robusta]
MLHELLFVLSGYDGDVFVLDKSTNLVKVAKNLPFVHPTEESLLNRICILATHYIKFKTYIDLTNNSKVRHQGSYKKAFVKGLELILEPYLKLLVDLEKKLIKDSHLTVAYIQYATENYQQWFPAVSLLVDQVSNDRVHGCEVLDLLHKSSITGVQCVRDNILNGFDFCLIRILKCCHTVLYRQLLSWMLHGELTNSTGEGSRWGFFIQHHLEDHHNVIKADNDDDDDVEKKSKRIHLYEVNLAQLPSYISVRVAQKILFIGQSVDLFRGNRTKGYHSMWQPFKESMMSLREEEFSRDIDELSKLDVFDAIKFESTIDKIKTYVAGQLRNLMVDEADIQSNLRRFKDFFLIGRGELFLTFIDQSQHLLSKPPTLATHRDVNLAFQHAARDHSLDEKLYKQFQLVIQDANSAQSITATSSSSKFLQTRESGWNCLRMVAHVQWPLHIVFTDVVVHKCVFAAWYSQLFSFLLYVKRIQIELQQCWSLQMQQRHQHCNKLAKSEQNKSPLHHSPLKWRLRNHMAFIVDNLQYYLQVDVIESQFSILFDKIQSSKIDFEEMLLAHETFLNSLLAQSFIHVNQVNHCLMALLDLCHSYYGLVVHAQAELTSVQKQKLEDISKDFHRQSGFLFVILSRIRNNPHLTQLLLRIDYNNYFSKSKFSSTLLTKQVHSAS